MYDVAAMVLGAAFSDWWNYNPSNDTTTAPASGSFRINAGLTELAIADISGTSVDRSAAILALGVGDGLELVLRNDGTRRETTQVSGVVVDHGTWIVVPISSVTSQGSGPPNPNGDVVITGFDLTPTPTPPTSQGFSSELDILRLYIDDKEDGTEQFNNETLQLFLDESDDDMHLAANRLWLVKAATVSDWYLTQTDGSLFARQQVFDHCKAMADYHLGQSAGEMVNVGLTTRDVDSVSSEF